MGVNWTPQQRQVIELRDRNILVSAAAGSGKTAVLVERIIAMLTDPVNPVDVDHLLVVTFTKAAATEMKDRIRQAIENLLAEERGNEHLERQAALIHSAQITTIDSFCQMVLKEHFHRINLDPVFRVAEEGELKLLKQDVLDELLEEKYDEADEGFLQFVEGYATGRDDKKLEALILQLYDFSRSYPNPENWLDHCAKAYHFSEENDSENIEFPKELEDQILRLAAKYLQDAKRMLDEAHEICMAEDGPYMYEEMIASDQKIVEDLLGASTFAEMYEKAMPVCKKTAWKRMSTKKDIAVSDEKKEYVKNLRNDVKKLVEEICGYYFYAAPEKLMSDIVACQKPMGVLINLVKAFSEKLAQKKQSRNIIDFGDMEQFALQILTTEKDGGLVPSQAALEYQDRYVEIMIDEYQDSNFLQEAILTSVSRVSRGKNNIFMVGDVKQSIYRFRLSRPELFMEKYDTYRLEDSDEQRIDLHKNFRSREEVLTATNFIFRQIMRRDLGGIEYDDRAALYLGADYLPQVNENGKSVNNVEVLLVDTDKEVVENLEVTDTGKELEARAVAARIKKLLQTGRVLDKESGEYRRPRYRDIVILTRSVKGWVDVFAEVLKKEGIPVYAAASEGYFETYEVSLLLDYLKILDNQKQDLPLTAVLTSPMCGLNVDDLTQIRNAFPEKQFYEAVYACASEDAHSLISENVWGKLNKTLQTMQYFREKVAYTAIQELLWEILEKTGYYQMMSAMPAGEQRRANLDMLLAKAAAFEETSYKGLFHFVRYIEQLKKYDVDYGEANVTDEQMDAVHFLSIHKSKGLEFPVVFVCGMNKHFNKQDSSGSIVIHPDLGVGIDAVDLTLRTKTPTLLKKILQREVSLENLGEELRVLYVALTRAKEKLILTGVLPKAEEKLQKYENLGEYDGTALSFGQLARANSYFDWILPALMRKSGDVPIDMEIVNLADLALDAAEEMQAESLAKEVLLQWDGETSYASEWRDELHQQMIYEYPYEKDQQMKLKFTVSELKKRAYLEEEAGELLQEEPEVVPLLPKFMQEEVELTGASRGTAYHRLLELLDFSENYDNFTLENQLQMLVESEKMSREMAECIREGDILKFLQTNTGKRMRGAAKKNLLRKEQPFVLGIDADEVYPGENSDELILVQGIIDAYFEEEDGLVLLDYKTDKIYRAQELVDRYHAQLEYYARALEQLTGKKVKEKWIYSFTLQKEILV